MIWLLQSVENKEDQSCHGHWRWQRQWQRCLELGHDRWGEWVRQELEVERWRNWREREERRRNSDIPWPADGAAAVWPAESRGQWRQRVTTPNSFNYRSTHPTPEPIMLLLPYTFLVVRFMWKKIPQKSCGLGLLNGDNMFKETSSKQRYQVWLVCWNLSVQRPLSPLFPFLSLFPNRILLRLIAITSIGVKMKLCTMYMCPMALLKCFPQNFCRLVRSLGITALWPIENPWRIRLGFGDASYEDVSDTSWNRG